MLLSYYMLWLFNLAGRTLLYGPLNSKVCFSRHLFEPRDIINILLTSFSRSELWVTDPHFVRSDLWAARFALEPPSGKNWVRGPYCKLRTAVCNRYIRIMTSLCSCSEKCGMAHWFSRAALRRRWPQDRGMPRAFGWSLGIKVTLCNFIFLRHRVN